MLHLLPDFREGADRGRGDGMRSQQLLQPDHMVPAVKFAAALGELPHRPEAQMGVEVQTVVGQIVVVLFGDGDHQAFRFRMPCCRRMVSSAWYSRLPSP